MANKTEEIAKQTADTAIAARPDYIAKGDLRGLEDITKKDMLVPFLGLAQPLSHQVIEGDPKFVEGMKPGDLYNSVTGQNYGREVTVQIVRKDKLRAMQFKSQEQGGGVLDPDVSLLDDRLKWGPNGEKPVATLFRDYIAIILPSHEMIALSFKSSGIAVAKRLNWLLGQRPPIFAGLFVIGTDQKHVPKPHKVYTVAVSKVNGGWVSAEDYANGEQMWEALKSLDTSTAIDRDDDDISFDTNTYDAQAQPVGTEM